MCDYKCPLGFKKGWIPTDKETGRAEIMDWEIYTNKKDGFEFRYPKNLRLRQDKNTIRLEHSIPFRHTSPCDFKGDAPPLNEVIDFSLSLELFPENFQSVVKKKEPFLVTEGYLEGNGLKTSPGFIDKAVFGTLQGYKITMGAECGVYIYYFPALAEKTLVVQRSWELTTEYGGRKDILELPGIISDRQFEKYLDQILSTFKFTNTSEFPTPKDLDKQSEQILRQVMVAEFAKSIDWEDKFVWTPYLAGEQPWGWVINGTSPVDSQFPDPSQIEQLGWKFVNSADGPGGSSLEFSKLENGVARTLYFSYQSDFDKHKKPTSINLFVSDPDTSPSHPYSEQW